MYMKLVLNQSFNNSIIWIALILIAWSPHIGLDYIYTEPTGETYRLNNGQYYFFVITLLSGLILLLKSDAHRLVSLFKNKVIIISLTLFFSGLALSNATFWNWRLLLIFLVISSCAIFAANTIYGFDSKRQKLAIILLTTPFAFPVLASLLLHFFGPLDWGIIFENSLHKNYSPERWYFLNSSANGFGLDAAICCITAYCFLRKKTSFLNILIMLLIFMTSVWVLLQSGTRAAYVFLIAAVVTYEFLAKNKNFIIVMIFSVFISIAGFIFVYGHKSLLSALRLGGDLRSMTSTRYEGMVGLWELFIQSPFRGSGFGAADFGLGVQPTNLFYFGMLAEVGVFGTLGALLFLFYPLYLIFLQRIKGLSLCNANNSQFSIWATCILAGFIPYLLFEFNVLRVSASNQLFSLCLFASIAFAKQIYGNPDKV